MQSSAPAPSCRRAPVRLAAALVLCAGLLAGCGSGGDEPSADPLPEPTAVVVPPEAVVPESDGGTGTAEAPAEDPTQDPAAEPTEDPEAEVVPATCTTLQEAWSDTNQALLSLSENHPRALVNSFRVATDSMARIDVDLPDAIADDWRAMSAYLARVNDAFEDVSASDADAVGSAFAAAVTPEDTREATTAAGRITDFLAAECATP